jgi:hypothetical protein
VLNRYFIRPTTVDRIRASWIGEPIERYVEWLSEQKYAARNVFSRVPLLIRFGEFAKAAGANSWPELPAHVDSFVEAWLRRRGREYSDLQRRALTRNLRNPIRQLLRLILPDVQDSNALMAEPFADLVPDFFTFLRPVPALSSATRRLLTKCEAAVNADSGSHGYQRIHY